MTDDKSPTDRLLDLLVFVPAGLAVTVVEELPRLADRGRERVETQVNTARMVGQFAVQFGRAELDRRFSGLLHRNQPSSDQPSSDQPSSDQPSSDQPSSDQPGSGGSGIEGPGSDDTASFRASPVAGANGAAPPASTSEGARPAEPDATVLAAGGSPRPDAAAGGGTREAGGDPAGVDGPVPAVEDLAIPGYDTLSASQVVQRLAGLSAEELRAVSRYEQSHRHRRTILNRVEQLVRATG